MLRSAAVKLGVIGLAVALSACSEAVTVDERGASAGAGGASSASVTSSSVTSAAGGGPTCPAATIIGVAWDGGTMSSLGRADPVSGVVTKLGSLNDQGPAYQAFDPASGRLYVFTGAHLITVDVTSGDVLAEVDIDSPSLANPAVNATGEIVVVHGKKSAKIDPTTGAIVDYAPLPVGVVDFTQGSVVVDRAKNVLYEFTALPSMLVIDGASALLLDTLKMPDEEIWTPFVLPSGDLIVDHGGQLGVIDPTSGAVTNLSPMGTPVEGLDGYDACSNTVYARVGLEIFSFDAASGIPKHQVQCSEMYFTAAATID